MLRTGFQFVLISWALLSVASAGARAQCELPYVYFDLGANTLVDTQTYNFEKIFYVPGAYEYLTDLKAKGYHLGLLVNVPQSWGRTQKQKLKATQDFIASKWTDTRPMDWGIFDLGVHFPRTDQERKPDPYLFKLAVKEAARTHCDAVYEGAIADEIPAATAAGMTGIQVGPGKWWGSYYYPEDKLRARDFPATQPGPGQTSNP